MKEFSITIRILPAVGGHRFSLHFVDWKNTKIRRPHLWQRGSTHKAGRRDFQDSIPGGVCWHTLSKFSVVFSEISVNMSKDPLEQTATEGSPLQAQVSQADNWP